MDFETETDAQDAVKYMDGSTLLERRIQVRPAGDRKEREAGQRHGFEFQQRQAPLQQAPRQAYGYRVEIEVRRWAFSLFLLRLFASPRRFVLTLLCVCSCVVQNLGPRTSWQDLKDFGRRAGPSVKYADIFEGPSGKCGYVDEAAATVGGA